MVQKAIRPDGKIVRSGLFGSGLTPMDLFVILATSITFLAAFTTHNVHGDRQGPPIDLIAQDLGITPQQFEAARNLVPRPPHGQPPTEAHKRQFATALNVSVERLDAVMEKYRPPERLRL